MNAALIAATLATLLCLTPAAVRAQATQHDTAGALTWENDWFGQSDAYYTNGMQFSLKHRLDDRWPATTNLLTRICENVGCKDHHYQYRDARFGQLMYTPVRINIAAPQPNDRPWAGLLYYQHDYHFLSGDQQQATTFTGQVGIIGPHAYAEQTQRWFHRVIGDSRDPLGWDNQVGSELGVLLGMERRFAAGGLNTEHAGNVQARIIGHWRAAAGNIMTFAGTGLTLMVGKDLSPVAAPPVGISVKALPPPPNTSCLFDWLQCTAFASVEARAVAWNAFLDGRMFGGGPSVDRRPLIGEASAGFRLDFPTSRNRWTGPLFFQFKYTRRTREFSSPGPVYVQSFGALTVGTDF